MKIPRIPFTREEAGDPGWKNIWLSTDWGQLDCLGEVTGIGDFETCLAQSEIMELGDFSLRILTLDALIRSKKAPIGPVAAMRSSSWKRFGNE